MKKFIIFIPALLVASANMFAQSLIIERTLMKIENASAIVQYNNYFSSLNNPDLDEPFPYMVIRMDLEGSAADVMAAKENIQLDLGTMLRVQQVVRTEQNRIIFLLPKGVKNIDLLCGDGCKPRTLWSGSLQINSVYACQIRYTAQSATVNGQDMSAVLAEINAKLEEMKSLSQNNQNSATDSETYYDNNTTYVSTPVVIDEPIVGEQAIDIIQAEPEKKLPDGVGLVVNKSSVMKKEGKKRYTLNDSIDMDNKEIVQFYMDNCPTAYYRYTTGKRCQLAGWINLGAGLAAVCGGIGALVAANKSDASWQNWKQFGAYGCNGKTYVRYNVTTQDGYQYYYDLGSKMFYIYNQNQYIGSSETNPLEKTVEKRSVGYALLAIGGAATIASIPLLSVGYSRQHKAHNAYNDQLLEMYYPSETESGLSYRNAIWPIQLNLNIAPQALGLALHF